MNLKKAVSPLIATILLIVVAVVLVTVVLTWGRGFTQDSLDTVGSITDDCTKTFGALAITSCSVTNNTVILKNNANFQITGGFFAEVTTEDGVVSEKTAGAAEDINAGQSISLAIGDGITTGYKVTVISTACPVDARASIVCR